MKSNKFIVIMIVICGFMSCQSNNNNVELTNFTKELVSKYIDDVDNFEARNGNDEIILISAIDTLYYNLSIFANDSKIYKYCRDDFIGQTQYLGYLIRVFGNENSFFYSVKEKSKAQWQCNNDFVEYDPDIWEIYLYKDLSFCRAKSYKGNSNESVYDLKEIVEKHFKNSRIVHDNSDSDIYQYEDVEIVPKFSLGEDSLRYLISSNFKIKNNSVCGKIPVVVGVVVDKDGRATLKGIIKSSNELEIDNEALRVTEIISQYGFIPAFHRGENVNAIYPVMFLKSDIVP